MKTVKFKRLFDGRTYGVLTTDIETEWDKDHSGTYVLLTEAETEIAALRERQRVLVEEMKTLCDLAEAMNNRLAPTDICTRFSRLHNLLSQVDVCRAALAAKEG